MTKTKKLLLSFVILLIAVALFYFYMAIQWANGMSEVVKEYVKIKMDLEDTIPTIIDSLYEEIILNLEELE